MALETLKGVEAINGTQVATVDRVRDHKNTANFIEVDHGSNSILFQIQNGPIKENGLNGCQVTDMIAVSLKIIQGLQALYPCRENAVTITKLEEALMWQKKRTEDREARNVEGKSLG